MIFRKVLSILIRPFRRLRKGNLESPDHAGPSAEELERRSAWFKRYVTQLDNSASAPRKEGVLYRCPCCGARTLGERGGFEICPVCFWEDDGQDDEDADVVRGGPNGDLSLTQGRKNFEEFGASDRRSLSSVRPAKPEELT
jgi:hypothetical protein